MIAAKVANALALDYPRERLQMIVASDGSADATAERARAAGADLVLELPPGGKVAALNAAAERASGEIARLLRRQQHLGAGRAAAPGRAASPTPRSATSAARSASSTPAATTSRAPTGATRWRCGEMESALGGITAGNGAHLRGPPRRLPAAAPRPAATTSRFPFALAKRGLRSLYAPAARAEEKMVPTLEGEFARKRRMMVGLWDIVVGEGMLSPARLPAALRLRARLAPAAALPQPAPAPRRPRRQRSPCSATAGSTPSPSPSSSALLAAALLGRLAARSRRCASPATT